MTATSSTLTESQKKFLERCESLFKDRYTEEDEEFMAAHNETAKNPPIVPFCSDRSNDRRMRFDYRSNNRHDDRSDGRRYDRNDRKRPHESGSHDYNDGYEKRSRSRYDDHREQRRY